MPVVRKYQLNLGIESKEFYLGNQQYLTVKDGTIVDENHVLVKKFPSHCVFIGEASVDTLNEEPVAEAVVVPEVEAPAEIVPEVAEIEITPILVESEAAPEVVKGKPGPKAKQA